MTPRTLAGSIVVIAAVVAAAACSTPQADARFVEAVPDRASFAPVAQAMVHSCGTLDCHGTVARNFKIYGNTGLRFLPTDVPSALTTTTDEEASHDYDSLVGLEPEVMSAVVASHGASPERLTFVRKARGAEAHKAGAIVSVGDATDTCFTTWLAGSVDTTACTKALEAP